MLRLNVGTNRKIGQPDFGSAGASCNLELELDTGLFQDLDGLQQVVRRAYAACHQAVNDELARLQGDSHHETAENITVQPVTHQPDIQQRSQPDVLKVRTSPVTPRSPAACIPAAQFTSQPSPRPATVSQVKAIRAICSRRRIDLVGLLRERFGLHTADELGIRQASDLIDELKSDGETPLVNGISEGGQTNGHANGFNAYQTNGGTR